MNVSEKRLAELKQKIIRAFDNVSYPKESFVALYDHDEQRGIREAFANKDWQTIEPKILEEFYDTVPLFSPEAFRYFLPAYLIYSLDNFSADDKTTAEFTIYALSPTKNDLRESLEYWQVRFEDFTFEQLDCIYDFLDLVGDDENYEVFVGDVNGGRKRLKTYIEPIIKNKKI